MIRNLIRLQVSNVRVILFSQFVGLVLGMSVKTLDILPVDNLPSVIKSCHIRINIYCIDLKLSEASLQADHIFIRFCSPFDDYEGFPRFIYGMATAVLPQGNSVHLFDSHSLDQTGLWLSNGRSLLLKFSNTAEMERHIHFIFLLNNR